MKMPPTDIDRHFVHEVTATNAPPQYRGGALAFVRREFLPAFAMGSRGLMAVRVVSALMHASRFYYGLGTSLLIKSITVPTKFVRL